MGKSSVFLRPVLTGK
uniref:Uncharacterized protein n=1 Tax=Anguilla anguilla TaxID=7936 RepID=A0A0E9T2U7_ANGAN